MAYITESEDGVQITNGKKSLVLPSMLLFMNFQNGIPEQLYKKLYCV